MKFLSADFGYVTCFIVILTTIYTILFLIMSAAFWRASTARNVVCEDRSEIFENETGWQTLYSGNSERKLVAMTCQKVT